MQPLTLKYENKILREGASVVIGCDEVGRGALAGPVVAAAVVFPKSMARVPLALRGVHDSKQLSARAREQLAAEIRLYARAWSVNFVSASVVDRVGIQKANMTALRRAVERAVEQLSPPEKQRVWVAVDGGVCVPGLDYEQESIVGGDGRVFSIAAASIIAKVARDSFMERQDEVYPGYAFQQHKGYGSSMHRKQIQKLGMSILHRKSFCGRIDEWGG